MRAAAALALSALCLRLAYGLGRIAGRMDALDVWDARPGTGRPGSGRFTFDPDAE